jgi:hypothetical protein
MSELRYKDREPRSCTLSVEDGDCGTKCAGVDCIGKVTGVHQGAKIGFVKHCSHKF